MKVSLLRYTPEPDNLNGLAAALCTGYDGNPERALAGAMASGHESVLEHSSFTFLITGISRVTLAQLTRHRLASFSVQSQRYAGINNQDVIMPKSIAEDEQLASDYADLVQASRKFYDHMTELGGIPAEDARYITPQGITTDLMMTMNARELRHFFSLRMCNRAQWEIRKLADEIYKLVTPIAPITFRYAGPGCVLDKCPEGKKCCGFPRKKELLG